MKETSRAKSIWHVESNQIATVLNSIHQFKIQAHRLDRSRSAQEINKPKTAKTKKAKDFSKSEAELEDVIDTFQHVISIIEKEMGKNLTVLQKEIDTRHEQRLGSARQ